MLLNMSNPDPHSRAKKVKTIEEVFQEVNKRCVRLKKKDIKNNNCILYEVLEKLLTLMRSCDNLFDSLNPKLEYLGSYFDGLRVGQPTEYDINVILTIHMDYSKIKLDAAEIQNGYTAIRMPAEFRRLSRTPDTVMKGFKKTELWCDNLFRLSVKKFREWMQSVVEAALNKLPSENGKRILKIRNNDYKINFKVSGPANTITIHTDHDNVIDIDLVPTLMFQLPKRPNSSTIDFGKVQDSGYSYYFAVPKPTAHDYSWRLAFPYQERYYIKDKNNLKSTLKLLKQFRDVQGFNKLASYFIKTLFLWEVEDKGAIFWKKSSLTFLVFHMLKKLKECLEIGTIKNFWCPEHNLLEKIKIDTRRNWSNRVSNIINDMERNKLSNPQIVLKYFTHKTAFKT
ncbi:uncharacterized protein LOC113492539 isoform X1 [Trichoplusia ni]|uniref:Uncharacterized protein LOC113492539 isoform X1 n=2 Tax=Trichoplusia ni TaxID=7111 RepID=A0A7E5VC03_TRINI|nr:uncharacterized protein LOC113492539 isoform X1 [Trichoplusia ni]